MKLLLSAAFLLLLQSTKAQQVIDVSKQDVSVGPNLFYSVAGEPFVNAKFVNLVEGTPYFKDEWLGAVLVGEGNREYKGVSIKLDLLDNSIHYTDAQGKEYIASTPINEIVLTDDAGNNYKFVKASTLAGVPNNIRENWVLWLCSGKASLYKELVKNLSEQKPYGSATTEQRIRTSEKYFILHNNSFTEIKKIKDIPSVLSDKRKELEEFLKTKDDAKASMDDRLTDIVDYYNSLGSEKK
jgi:hypothetical protein